MLQPTQGIQGEPEWPRRVLIWSQGHLTDAQRWPLGGLSVRAAANLSASLGRGRDDTLLRKDQLAEVTQVGVGIFEI